MRFGVLGSLAVWTSEGRVVRVPEVKVRSLLADLLIHAGRVVPAERIIDDLWGERLPANPAGALQTRVSQLRRALEDAEPGVGRGLVVSRNPGYVLQVPPEATDTGRFLELTTRARATTSPRTRTALFADALALWRGDVLADFADEEFAQPEIARLTELRLTVLEEQAEARLESGDHALLADELGDLVTRHPLRERLRAAQLRALYRAGRQSEALASYTALREQLADELGLDPGPELVTLYESILRQDPSLTTPPPQAAATAAPTGNLPAALGKLVGREDTIADVRQLLTEARLVTLTGPGGVGKTRLAVETARGLSEAYPDGVWLVELAGVPGARASGEGAAAAGGGATGAGGTSDLEAAGDTAAPGGAGGRAGLEAPPGTLTDIAERIAAALGLREETAVPGLRAGPAAAIDRLAESLRSQHLLLVLDNCEHVIDAAAGLVSRLLTAAPGLHVLATAQEPLGVRDERLRPVAPLPPEAAVRLFAERAAASAPGFTVDTDNADAVAAICRRLDGIPLALELAATRVRALGVRELAARLDDRFRLLSAGPRDAPARQRTLRAMIDWSWELLDERERAVLRRLSVFADGSPLAAAEAVCAGGELAPEEVLDPLARLVDRSLVTLAAPPAGPAAATEAPRYRLLESVAAYGRERLHEAGEYEATAARHYRYHRTLAATAEPALRGPEQRTWLRTLDAEAGNFRAALDAAVRATDAPAALGLAVDLAWYWCLRGRLREARRFAEAALSVSPAAADAGTTTAPDPDPVIALSRTAATWHASLSYRLGEVPEPGSLPADPPPSPTRSLDLLTAQARADWHLGYARLGMAGPPGGPDQLAAAEEIFRTTGDTWGMAAVAGTLAQQSLLRGDLPALAAQATRSMTLFTELGDGWGQLQATIPLGAHAEITGDYAHATRLHLEGLRLAEDLGVRTEAADKLAALGRIALLEGDHARADELHARAARTAAEQGYAVGEEFAEIGLALSARRQGHLDKAEALLTKWLPWDRKIDSPVGTALILAELGFVAELHDDAATARDLHLEGLTLARTTSDPRAMALALEGLAGAASLAASPDSHHHAAELLGRATHLRAKAGAPLPPGERTDTDRITDRLRKTLGDEALAAALERGSALPLEATVTAS
ncbi:BTAD domain-containing putative transcriptional regulator [Streptomyces boninensis]|uniref:BTAD domain-containing putative transcriptional regulator n=1 Tax=Streptomyces boninensis TaxID=2039455 RepID=UPI003B225CD9